MSCGVGHRCGSDLALLWLWCRPAAAAPIQPLAWELPYAVGVDLKSKQTNKKLLKKTSYDIIFSRDLDSFSVAIGVPEKGESFKALGLSEYGF